MTRELFLINVLRHFTPTFFFVPTFFKRNYYKTDDEKCQSSIQSSNKYNTKYKVKFCEYYCKIEYDLHPFRLLLN